MKHRITSYHTLTLLHFIYFFTEFLPPYKQLLGGLFILNEVPVGKTGKVIRRALSQLDPPKVSQHP